MGRPHPKESFTYCLTVPHGIGILNIDQTKRKTAMNAIFQPGQIYNSNENKSMQFKVVSRTKCFVTVQKIWQGEFDEMFAGSGKAKVKVINNKEYFDSGIYSCFAS